MVLAMLLAGLRRCDVPDRVNCSGDSRSLADR
jgi:hypothetical protein